MKRMILSLLLVLFLVGCTPIKDIKDDPDSYIGEKVTVRGTASGVLKIGSLSGFTLEDNEGNRIAVSSSDLPKEGEKLTVSGVVMKDTLFGTYILVKD